MVRPGLRSQPHDVFAAAAAAARATSGFGGSSVDNGGSASGEDEALGDGEVFDGDGDEGRDEDGDGEAFFLVGDVLDVTVEVEPAAKRTVVVCFCCGSSLMFLAVTVLP